jgi:RND family efflux transporter MFP subunit
MLPSSHCPTHLRCRAWRLLLLSLLLVAGGCNRDSAESDESAAAEGEEPPVAVAVRTPRRAPISRFIPAAGTLEPVRSALLVTQLGGPLAQVAVAEGERVASGARVACVDAVDLELQLRRARLAAERDRNDLERLRRLFERELVSKEEFEAARSRARISALESEIAAQQLSRACLAAPFAGVISELLLRQGETAAPGAAVARLVADDPLWLQLYLPAADLRGLRPGQLVEVQIPAADSSWRSAPIRRLGAVVDAATGTVKVTVELPNPEHSLRPGAFARARVITGRREDVLQVPQTAILYEGRTPFVYCVQADTVVQRPLEVGWSAAGWSEVRAGLEPDAAVITLGQGALQPGDPVQVVAGADSSTALAVEQVAGGGA